jgi:hypothetical protein
MVRREWTIEDDDFLRKLVAEGKMSLVEMGVACGRTYTSVEIRLSLMKRGKLPQRRKTVSTFPSRLDVIDKPKQRITVSTPPFKTCQFIHGEPAARFFCGQPVSLKSYCKEHAKVCFENYKRLEYITSLKKEAASEG